MTKKRSKKVVKKATHLSQINESYEVLNSLTNTRLRQDVVLGKLQSLNPFVFEELVMSALERQGHRIIRNASYSNDGGVDGRVYLHGVPHLIQCKRVQGHVSSAQIRDFARKCTFSGCRGLFVHTGKQSDQARSYQETSDITLVAEHHLVTLIAGHQPCLPVFKEKISLFQWLRRAFPSLSFIGAVR